MNQVIVYDKVKWHYPEGENCPNLETAEKHFKVIMEWLNANDLLSKEGKEIMEFGIDSEFALTSSMLTKKGNEIINKGYSEWLKKIDYDKDIDMDYWNSIKPKKKNAL